MNHGRRGTSVYTEEAHPFPGFRIPEGSSPRPNFGYLQAIATYGQVTLMKRLGGPRQGNTRTSDFHNMHTSLVAVVNGTAGCVGELSVNSSKHASE